MAEKHIDELSGVETTGHEWDGIKELNNPMPRWWVYTFYATIVWAIGYTIAFPAWPLLSDATRGVLGYSSRAELAQEVNVAAEGQKVYLDKIAAMPVADIAKDAALNEFAMNGGAAAFKVNCAPCHGSGAQGGPGFPNLNDNDWLWGGKVDDIYATIAHGIRSEDPDTRISEMPAFADMLQPDEIKQVAAYVVSLTGTPADAAMVEPGKQLFADNCASCHGENAQGNREFGAPNLADAIWLKGEGEDAVIRQISAPKHGMMPAWGGRLSDATIKQLAVYVHALGGGE
ncbi:cytochrome c oxidase cbb3-type subunit 3 [Rhizobium sp. SG_E_25_P2]|uniref:cytochrome-c oxidase, cbb3-type subunit III n=1 Tax=Rhizobium sp. SG_E_25_P2 TaxID=2879942 RepID=UPI002475DA80|nr:cytochrome-c oxidase, cbb3-type subunit III [Rhizobium sp. SG_E_25_P2]MDH6267266.1 cytochrome c oxidase cbb3-type subunit 3 [Rhizobium sp. SG_E_25_P2]